MSRKPRILIVEDEEAIRIGLVDMLIFHGYETEAVADGTAGLQQALSGTYDLILLDVMLPGVNGFEICDRIREADREQPIIMLTARSDDEDIIQGLQLGADDYVAKPFSAAQLVLRIKAVLRRSRGTPDETAVLHLDDDLVVDTRNLSAERGGETIRFTRREMDVLQYLHTHADRPVSREELLSRLWGYARSLDLETRTVDIHIAKLRRKIEHEPANPKLLVTVRGAGYRLLAGQ